MPCSRFPHSLLCFVIPVPRVLILWYKSQALNYASLSELRTCVKIEVAVLRTLQAPLSGTFLQTLPDLVTPLKGHSLSPRSCPPTRSAPSERTTVEANHTPSIAFRHLPPNSARFSYATEGALFIYAQLSTSAVSALRKVRVLI